MAHTKILQPNFWPFLACLNRTKDTLKHSIVSLAIYCSRHTYNFALNREFSYNCEIIWISLCNLAAMLEKR